jgi:hypothetical protein
VVTRSEWFQQNYVKDAPEEAKATLLALYHKLNADTLAYLERESRLRTYDGRVSDPGSEED